MMKNKEKKVSWVSTAQCAQILFLQEQVFSIQLCPAILWSKKTVDIKGLDKSSGWNHSLSRWTLI